MNRHLMITLAFVSGLLLVSTPGQAQTLKKSALSGLVVSKSTSVPDDSTPHSVYTTPALGAGFFVLTQFCATATGISNLTLSGGGVTVVNSGGDECTSFSPGITFPAATSLTCLNQGTGSTETCMITGVVSSK